jgi:hypothetical protein
MDRKTIEIAVFSQHICDSHVLDIYIPISVIRISLCFIIATLIHVTDGFVRLSSFFSKRSLKEVRRTSEKILQAISAHSANNKIYKYVIE